uniref:RNA helicase n=1 Tax=Syphacia muris TaxID=451379 RepID=A0A158R5A4_9BILA
LKQNFPKKLKSISGAEKKNYYETDSESDSNPEDVLKEASGKKFQDLTASEVVQKRTVECPGSAKQHMLVERNEEIQKQRAKLPIFEDEQAVVEAVNENTTVIICGETGSGKSTQLPQFLYEAGYAGDDKLIGITEPRRVAAISLSKRVGYELCNPEIVSYQIRYEGNRTDKTRILFVTDGVLMKELQNDLMLSKFSVIIIDEAHERSVYSDVLIGLLSRIAPLRAKSSNPLKFIIMSATLRLTDFTQKILFPLEPPRVLKVDARQYPVVPYFERRTPQNYIQAAFRKICRIHETKPPGTILVFLSGRLEVEELISWLKKRYPYRKGGHHTKFSQKDRKCGKILKLESYNVEEEVQKINDFDETDVYDDDSDEDIKSIGENDCDEFDEEPLGPPPHDVTPLYCLPLYSLLPSDKQSLVFQPFPETCRGCIVATNVAETSLTIPGVRYVVDTGREKRRLYDSVTGVSKFSVEWISQASADQRMGRAGRVQAGEVYRLYSRQFYADLKKFSEPEILNKPVDQLVLLMKSMNIVKVKNFPFPSKPSAEALEEAEKRLIRLGALEVVNKNGSKEARINSFGKSLSLLPLDPRYGKMILMAKQNNLLQYACCVVASLSVREPLIPLHSIKGATNEETMNMMLKALKVRRSLSGQGQSKNFGDMGVLLKMVLKAEASQGNLEMCAELGIRQKALIEIRKLRQQLTNLINTLCSLDFPLVIDLYLQPPDDKQIRMLRQIVIASLTENIARRVNQVETTEEVPKNAYECQKLKDYVFVDASSILYKDQPDWVLFLEIVEINGKKLMRDVMAVESEWLPQLAQNYCSFESIKGYDPVKDAIVISSTCFFGEQRWKIGTVDRPIQKDLNLYRLFAQYILDGTVFPSLSVYTSKLLASPSTMLKPWAKLQRRTENLLNELIASKAALLEVWEGDSTFLLQEYLAWLPSALHDRVQLHWPPKE